MMHENAVLEHVLIGFDRKRIVMELQCPNGSPGQPGSINPAALFSSEPWYEPDKGTSFKILSIFTLNKYTWNYKCRSTAY